MKKIYGYILMFLVIFVGAIGAPSIYPSTVKMDLTKGHNYSTVTVFNTGDKVMKYKLGINSVDNLGNKSELAPYLTVFPKYMEINPGESQVVRIIAKGIPVDKFEDGEYRAALSVEELESSIHKKYKTKQESGDVSTVINFKYVINMAIYGYLGKTIPKLEVKDVKINKKNITGHIKNEGNYSYFIKYQILDKSDKVLKEEVLFKLLYGQEENFSIPNVEKGSKIRLIEKDINTILYK